MLDPKTGMSKAHTWTRGTPKAPPLPLEVTTGDTILTHPLHIGQHFVKQWTDLWAQHEDRQDTLAQKLKSLIDVAEAQPLKLITGDDVTQAMKYLAKNTALGIDHWSPEEWRRLPTTTHQAMAELLNRVEAGMAWPRHIVHNIIVLMGKPQGGTRPIALMPMLYRIWTKIRKPYIEQWEQQHAGPWDAAVKGSSALRAAYHSQFYDEIGHYLQYTNGTILFDMEKFYDNVDVHKLITLATKHEYPTILLTLGLQMHMGIRGLKCYNMHPGFKQPSNGIIAGCTQSTTFAKILLMDAMIEAHRGWITHNSLHTQIRTFVDDIRVTTREPMIAVRKKSSKTVPTFTKHLKEIGCKIGSKTTCLGSNQAIRDHLLKTLRAQKIRAQTAYASKDLGILTAVGVRRRSSTISKRLRVAKARAIRANKLAMIDRRATTLYKTGVYPQATYGVETIGLSPTQATELRAIASQLSALGIEEDALSPLWQWW